MGVHSFNKWEKRKEKKVENERDKKRAIKNLSKICRRWVQNNKHRKKNVSEAGEKEASEGKQQVNKAKRANEVTVLLIFDIQSNYLVSPFDGIPQKKNKKTFFFNVPD